MPYILPKPTPAPVADFSSPKAAARATLNGKPLPRVCTPMRKQRSLDDHSAPRSGICFDRPLKSALKGSWSPDTLRLHPQSLCPPPTPATRNSRQRAKSVPYLPSCSEEPHEMEYASTTRSESPPPPPRSVHFPSPDAGHLESVCFFRKRSRPVSVSHPEETDTETEGESSASSIRYDTPIHCFQDTFTPGGKTRNLAANQRAPSPLSLPLADAHVEHRGESPVGVEYEVDDTGSSAVPSSTFDPSANVHLESLSIQNDSPSHDQPLALVGAILVRNIAYEKEVTVRFTFDDWTTTSNTSASYTQSLPSSGLPRSFVASHCHILGPSPDYYGAFNRWDRFTFTIPLEPVSFELPKRVLWFAARFSIGQGREWWDNNAGQNYRVAFRIRGSSSPSAPAAFPPPNLAASPATLVSSSQPKATNDIRLSPGHGLPPALPMTNLPHRAKFLSAMQLHHQAITGSVMPPLYRRGPAALSSAGMASSKHL